MLQMANNYNLLFIQKRFHANLHSSYHVVRVDNNVVRFMTDADLFYEASLVEDKENN